jgi:putative DNA primase/helicase
MSGALENDVRLTDQDAYPLGDYGNAQRLLAMHGDNIRFCEPLDRWFVWDGHRFEPDAQSKVARLMHEVLLQLVTQAAAARDEIATKFAYRSLNRRPIENAIKVAGTLEQLSILPEQLDQNPYLLNFLNGTVDLRTGELRPHRREDLITKLIHFNYAPAARCDLFLKFLARSVGHGAVLHLQTILGYALVGVTTEKMIFFFLGPRDVGKTTLLTLYGQKLIPEYAGALRMETIMSHEMTPNVLSDLADLRGKRFVNTSEVEEYGRLNVGLLKRLCQGRGTIKANHKCKDGVVFPETYTIFIDTNYTPVVKETGDADWSRLKVVQFGATVPKKERIEASELEAEAEGVLAWAVAGAVRWCREGLGELPEEWNLAQETWREDMNFFAHYLQNRCVVNERCSSLLRPLFRAYEEEAKAAGERYPLKEMAFAIKLRELGFKPKNVNKGTLYLGIGLRADVEQSHLDIEN